ncbi:MAG: hypothetical protein KGL90_09975 [Burkholderiales bacterium]|nr:hypothetical protein [Burkholderiales bacterium]
MSESTFFVSEAAVRNLKGTSVRRIYGISSAHLSEAFAAAIGFRTNAALRAALVGQATVEVPKPSNARLLQRLRELGYTSVPDDLQLVPELQHSYTPFRQFPLNKRRGVRWNSWRNLVVMAINAGLEQRLFGLQPTDNWWPGAARNHHECQSANYRFNVASGIPAIASVDAHAGDELSIQVVLDPKRLDVNPSIFCGLSDGDAVAHCWLERRLGAWIQDGGEGFSCKRTAQAMLVGLNVMPKGYADQGSFIL